MEKYDKEGLISEIKFRTSRSSGPGGQAVNKLSTKVELIFDIKASAFLTEEQKEKLFEKLAKRINSDGLLIVTSDQTRSQLRNKELVTERFLRLLENALKPAKKRKPTFPTQASVEKRLQSKKHHAAKKELRRPPRI